MTYKIDIHTNRQTDRYKRGAGQFGLNTFQTRKLVLSKIAIKSCLRHIFKVWLVYYLIYVQTPPVKK